MADSTSTSLLPSLRQFRVPTDGTEVFVVFLVQLLVPGLQRGHLALRAFRAGKLRFDNAIVDCGCLRTRRCRGQANLVESLRLALHAFQPPVSFRTRGECPICRGLS